MDNKIDAADRAADLAAENHRKFRAVNWVYFASTDRVLPNGVIVPRARNEALERESFRLFEITRNANKLALDLEHEAAAAAANIIEWEQK